MEIKELVKKALRILEREKEYILFEGKLIQSLKKAVEERDEAKTKAYENACSRTSKREHRFEEKLKEFIDALRALKPELNKQLAQLEEQLILYEKNIISKVSNPWIGEKGSIPKLLKQKPLDWEQLETEADSAYNKGIQQLVILLDDLKKEFEKYSKEKRYILPPGMKAFINKGKRRPEIYVGTLNEPSFLATVEWIKQQVAEVEAAFGAKWYLSVEAMDTLYHKIKKLPFMGSTIGHAFGAPSMRIFDKLMDQLNEKFKQHGFLLIEDVFRDGDLTCFTICLAAQKALGPEWSIAHIYEKQRNKVHVETHTFLLRHEGDKVIFLDLTIPGQSAILYKNSKQFKKTKIIHHDASLRLHKKFRVFPQEEFKPDEIF